MTQTIMILYDLQKKSNGERSRILQKLYGYSDKSNYNYSYERKGMLENIKHEKLKKTVIKLINKKDISKVTEILQNLKVDFEIARV